MCVNFYKVSFPISRKILRQDICIFTPHQNDKITMIKLLSLFISCFFISSFYSQFANTGITDFTSEEIKTVWFENEEWRLAYPVASLNTDNPVTLHFDLMGSGQDVLWYRMTHCDRDWNDSELFASDFMEGFEENQINQFQASFNTTISYTHYSLTLPNEDVRLKISGNYIITIYRSGEEDRPLLRKRFYISEGTSTARVIFRRPMKPGTTDTHQQAEITVNTGMLQVNDLYRDITLTVMQNGRDDKSKMNLHPDFVGNGIVEYNTLSDKTLFEGGNEFRFFDIKTIKQKRQNVRAIEYLNGCYHVFLLPSEERRFKPYFSNEDFNGKYYIAMEESNEPDRDADYVYVYFTLPADYEKEGGSVYVTGAFTDWKYTSLNRMTYNPTKRWYEASLLLKQGWYNYEYVFVPEVSGLPESIIFEGSHYETGNDYLILTYFRDSRQRYDRLTGAEIVNTSGQIR